MFSQTTEYALRAMAWLALSPNELVPTITLAEKTKVPSHYLAKVLQQLSAADLVTGRRGVRGGYKLAKPAAEITLTNVVRAVSKLERIKVCPLGIATHGVNLCPLHRMMDAATAAVMDLLDEKSLADLLNQPGMSTPLCAAMPTNLNKVGLSVDGMAVSR